MHEADLVEKIVRLDRSFFTMLIEANVEALGQLLADDFTIIDILSGSIAGKAPLLAAVSSGQVKFTSVDALESTARTYGTAAVVTGRTHLKGDMAGTPFDLSSRYTHVYPNQEGVWQLVAAQGTRICGT
jgi:ketosteroid isomerase-like protein